LLYYDERMQSVGAENTFSGDLTEIEAILSELQPLINKEFLLFRSSDRSGKLSEFVVLFRMAIWRSLGESNLCFSLERTKAAYAVAVGMSFPKHLIMQL
jgi:hypothetical protein